jgi:hypothetical protein
VCKTSHTEFTWSILPPGDWNRRRQFRVAEWRNVRRARPESAVDFAPCVLGVDEAEKPAKTKGFFRRAKRAVSQRWA